MKTKIAAILVGFLLLAGVSARADLYLLGMAIDQVGVPGGWQQIGPAGGWKDTNAGVVFNGMLYTTETAGGLWASNPNTGEWKHVGKNDFANTKFMFADGQSLYTIETDGTLYQVSPRDGAWKRVGAGGGWKDTAAGAVLEDRLYTISTDGRLWETDLQSGAWKQIGTGLYPDTRLLWATGDSLVSLNKQGDLNRIEPVNGGIAQIGAASWVNTRAGTILDGKLYTTENDGRLYVTDLKTGKWQSIGQPEFGKTTYMFSVAGKLCTIETSGNLYYVSAGIKNDRTVDSFSWCPEEMEKAFRDQGGTMHGTIHSQMILGNKLTHDAAMTGLKWLQDSTAANDLAVVFVDAHGSTDPNKGWGIFTADHKTLWGREIKTELGKLKCQVIVFDETCESGGFAQPHPEDVPVPDNVTALCACNSNETTNNQLDLAVGEALYGRADFNHDGSVDVGELIAYVKKRYLEWWPNPKAGSGSNSPVIAQGKTMPDNFVLTKVSPALGAVAVGGGFFSAIIGPQEGDEYKVHLLGWSSHPGEPYFVTDHANREDLCLPDDGKPVQVQEHGQWLPGRIVSQDGGNFVVHVLGEKRDVKASNADIKYPFVGESH